VQSERKQALQENFFFDLKRHATELRELVGREGFVLPSRARNEVSGWISKEVRDFSISRAAVAWGIPLPREPSQTVYVWLMPHRLPSAF
jgi:methionyl-tRNA synthetase